jgi:predicted AlkP superfamily pyrophosphatase or phosphodiesterase
MARIRSSVVVCLCLILHTGNVGQASAPSPPKLVVLLVVDQMRADYVDRFGHQWTGGLKRLVNEGASYRQAAYPYLNTVTCVGHATISTGTFPARHGIVNNSWFDREANRSVGCAEDPKAAVISYGAPISGGYSTARLLVPTLADELRAQLPVPPRIVTFSIKERTAVVLAGRRADAVTWFNAGARSLATSSTYTDAPVPFVQRFSETHSIETDFGKSWTRTLPADRYLYDDAGRGEKPPSFWTSVFPHQLDGRTDRPGDDFYDAWESSPFSDAYLGGLAEAAIDGLELGKGPGTDFLAISFTALDLVGHDFGPSSHEVQDVLVRLDQTIGSLLAHLDRTVGRANYVVALTSDHGSAPIPEQVIAKGLNGGRLGMGRIVERTEKTLQQAFGPGKYVARLMASDLYLAPGVAERLRSNPAARDTVLDAISAVPGVARVFFSDALVSLRTAEDRDARAAALSYYPGRSGDIIIVPTPYWFFVSGDGSKQTGSAATHGSPYDYDQRVPIILFGAGIRPGEYLRRVTPADIAPTLAFLCGITLASPDGRPLVEALAAGAPTSQKATTLQPR